jgi:regulation of enolase protein 1 (concanavalin A-like superfamily)
MSANLLSENAPGFLDGFVWTNPAGFSRLPGGGMRVNAPARTDFFRDPAGKVIADSAPYLHLPVTGDFVARAQVRHPFRSTYDAAALMVWIDPAHWAKLCFEYTDFGTHAIVSVVTNGTSDDANGPNYIWPVTWLQVARVGQAFGLHYSPDGEQWQMTRVFRMEAAQTLEVGMVAQSPVGDGAEIDFLSFQIEKRTLKDLRSGK